MNRPPPRPPGPPGSGPPVNAAKHRLADFLIQNYGVLVTVQDDEHFHCEHCGVTGLFASSLPHTEGCVLYPFIGQLGTEA